jgi:hypothetical protein
MSWVGVLEPTMRRPQVENSGLDSIESRTQEEFKAGR